MDQPPDPAGRAKPTPARRATANSTDSPSAASSATSRGTPSKIAVPSYYDPPRKFDRTAAKYAADKKRDARLAKENRAFVAEFLATHTPPDTGGRDPAATLAALRAAARRERLKKGKGTAKTRSKPAGGKRRRNAKAAQPASPKARSSAATSPKPGMRTATGAATPRSVPPAPPPSQRPWLKRRSSLRFLDLPDEALLEEYFRVVAKIQRWKGERAASVDRKRQEALAEQIQIQYEKRHDLLALISDRTLEILG